MLRYKSLVDKSLTANNNGWKLDLFFSIDEDFICSECNNVCKKAVSLMCEFKSEEDEHDDEDIKLYCESCMKLLLVNNGDKCPISNHSNPKYLASRIARKKIMRSKVLCPNSIEYQQKIKFNQSNNNNQLSKDAMMSSLTIDATSEGKDKDIVQGCTHFKGTLSSLIEKHIFKCIEEQLVQNNDKNSKNINRMYLHMIEDLQEKNVHANQDIKNLENKLKYEIQTVKDEMQQKFDSMMLLQTLMKQEMKMNAENIENCRKWNAFSAQGLVYIPLKINSCRKIFEDRYHPRNLLQAGTSVMYCSVYPSDFVDNEKDWIIFEVNDIGLNAQHLYIPLQIRIRNSNDNQGVRNMLVWLGSVYSNEWLKLHSVNELGIEMQSTSLQLFELDCSQSLISIVAQKKWRHIKVQFTANHGGVYCNTSKYICYELQFCGKKLLQLSGCPKKKKRPKKIVHQEL